MTSSSRAPSSAPAPPSGRAKPLPRKLPTLDVPALVPARMVNEVLYCERLMALEWVQGEFSDNRFTVEGRAVHKRADKPGRALPPPTKVDDEDDAADTVGIVARGSEHDGPAVRVADEDRVLRDERLDCAGLRFE